MHHRTRLGITTLVAVLGLALIFTTTGVSSQVSTPSPTPTATAAAPTTATAAAPAPATAPAPSSAPAPAAPRAAAGVPTMPATGTGGLLTQSSSGAMSSLWLPLLALVVLVSGTSGFLYLRRR
jgi:hypothetical protein